MKINGDVVNIYDTKSGNEESFRFKDFLKLEMPEGPCDYLFVTPLNQTRPIIVFAVKGNNIEPVESETELRQIQLLAYGKVD